MIVRGLSSAWRRLAPLSAGAVTASLAVVSATRMLRRLLGDRRRDRGLGWSATVVLLPLGLWLLTGPGSEDGGEADEASEMGPNATESGG